MSRLAAAAAILAVSTSLGLAACGSAPPRVELPETRPAIVTQVGHLDPAADLPIASNDVTFTVAGNAVPATIVRPTTGVWPGVVLMAGSGPTDRNWEGKLLAGKNGSGRLLAEALARRGAVVIRFDKAGVGGNHLPYAKVTLDTYVDEARGALSLLRGRPDVDAAHLFVAGNSEGGIHAIRVGVAEGGHIAGVLLLSSAGRSMRDIILGQLGSQLATAVAAGKLPADEAKRQLEALTHAFDDFINNKPVDPTQVSAIPGIQQLVASLIVPETARLMRDLLSFDPADAIGKLRVPVLVVNGLKDVQVDPQLDAARLDKAARDGGLEVTLFLAPDANHVLKHETRTTVELRGDLAGVQDRYNADGVTLDDTTVAAIANWIASHDR